MFALADDVVDGSVHVWTCGAGHRGPLVTGLTTARPSI
jgi:hypothetical protein